MKTYVPLTGFLARTVSRVRTIPMAYCAPVALASLALGFSSIAEASSAPASNEIIRVELEGGHDDLDRLIDDDGMFLLSSLVTERQVRSNGDALNMDALLAELDQTFESALAQEPEFVYTVVCIDGHHYTICRLREAITVVDPLLSDPVSVTQTTTMRVN